MSRRPDGSHPVFGRNRLKLGTFCTNASPFLVKDPRGWEPTWAKAREAARLADAAGFEAVIPLARWKGFVEGDPSHLSHQVLDPFIFAAGVSQVTRRCAVFSTVQAATMHPVLVAKQAATLDHLSEGRCGLNVVGGWNAMDNEMFGIGGAAVVDRYAYLADWLATLRTLCSSDDEVDIVNRSFVVKSGLSRPRPVRADGIPVINAGLSDAGAMFAAQHADIALAALRSDDPGQWSADVARYKRLARETFGREIQVWTNVVVLQRDTDAEADAFMREFDSLQRDDEAVAAFLRMLGQQTSLAPGTPGFESNARRVAFGAGTLLKGSGESVARGLGALSRAGVDGVIIAWPDPVEGIARFRDGVLPLLEVAGLRERDDVA